jgi:hypothetical protein
MSETGKRKLLNWPHKLPPRLRRCGTLSDDMASHFRMIARRQHRLLRQRLLQRQAGRKLVVAAEWDG